MQKINWKSDNHAKNITEIHSKNMQITALKLKQPNLGSTLDLLQCPHLRIGDYT